MNNEIVNINFSGATYNILDSQLNINYVIEGTGTLTNDYAIAATGTVYEGRTHYFQVKCNVTLGGNTFKIFGVDVTEENLKREGNIIAVYNGASWDVNIQPSSRPNNWLTVQDTPSDLNKEIATTFISFEALEQGKYRINSAYDCYILKWAYTINKDIAGTDNANIDVYISGAPATGLDAIIPMGVSIGFGDTIISPTPTSNFLPSNGYLDFETFKTTAGGKGGITVTLQRA